MFIYLDKLIQNTIHCCNQIIDHKRSLFQMSVKIRLELLTIFFLDNVTNMCTNKGVVSTLLISKSTQKLKKVIKLDKLEI
mmetsp:Transcript_40370/g.94856  ORF Transcript_40370/g.94856 Transcript_40370/m.94856 type:complete len:80 (+) Transcript_40370:658-897(+)